MGCFRSEAKERLREKPLQQIRRDHLLTGAVKVQDGYADEAFVFLYPRDNAYCSSAVAAYEACLSNVDSFIPWTLEGVVSALSAETDAQWVGLFEDRYLAFGKLGGY